MKHTYLAKIAALAALVMTIGVALSSCNKESDDPNEEVQPSLSVAVKTFKLQPDARVMANLDSVYFSIDLDRGVIFNADSLPLGTNVEKIVPLITFPSTVETAEIIMTGGNLREGTVNYKTNATDTIDFSGSVVLRLTADGGNLSRDYDIRINVHKAVADSLMWDKVAYSKLPSRLSNPTAQKTAQLNSTIYTLLQENDGTYTMASTADISKNEWTKTPVALPFTPAVESMAASSEALYILDVDGNLMQSSDGLHWSDTGTDWHHILGGFGNAILGIAGNDAAGYSHDIFPRPEGYAPSPLEENFPTDATSSLLEFSSRWADDPFVFFTGGRRGDRTLAATWAFDGHNWSEISNNPLPPLADALLIPYFVYRKTSASWIQTEYSVVICTGGEMQDGSLSRKVYLSYDNGVNWTEADTLMQLPDFVPTLADADAVIFDTPMKGNLLGWEHVDSPQPTGAKVQYFVDGTQVEWACPYIYIIGGRQANGILNDKILRAVLARLTFTPIF